MENHKQADKKNMEADCFVKLPEHIGFVALFKLGFLLGAWEGGEIDFNRLQHTMQIKFRTHRFH